jgi:hypothetical protein
MFFLYIDIMRLLLLILPFVWCYKLLPNLKCELPKYFEPCLTINKRLLEITKDVFKDLNNLGLPVYLNKSNNSICSQDYTHYGQMLYDPSVLTSKTDLLFKNSIVYSPNTAYNIVLHETLHSLGLDHTTDYGMMNYAVSENWYGGLINDQRKLWLSADDINGIFSNCVK